MTDTKFLDIASPQPLTSDQAQSPSSEALVTASDTTATAQLDDQSDYDYRLAEYYSLPSFQAASAIAALCRDEVDAQAMTQVLLNRAAQIHAGDLTSVLELLVGQAAVLSDMACNMTIRMADAMFHGHVEKMAVYGGLALKSHALLLRATATIADVQSPKRSSVFIGQQNYASGHQQVINNQQESQKNSGNGEKLASELLDFGDERHE